ncbi:hypothetical protein FHG87_023295 [Trinorchestia longiramus]|nr:hypothetical protein FHG87_023295 [Trinorchestia longiramus]
MQDRVRLVCKENKYQMIGKGNEFEQARQHIREVHVDENELDIDTDHRMLVLKYKWDRTEVMQEMSNVKEKWCLKAANWEEFDEELGRCEWNRNGNVNDMNKEMGENIVPNNWERKVWKIYW